MLAHRHIMFCKRGSSFNNNKTLFTNSERCLHVPLLLQQLPESVSALGVATNTGFSNNPLDCITFHCIRPGRSRARRLNSCRGHLIVALYHIVCQSNIKTSSLLAFPSALGESHKGPVQVTCGDMGPIWVPCRQARKAKQSRVSLEEDSSARS